MTDLEGSISAARATWNRKAVGSQRSNSEAGTLEYFEQIRAYRYGYETPFIPSFFQFSEISGQRVLEIGVGQGIDGVEMARNGALYSGIDVTEAHLNLTRQNFANHTLPLTLFHGDLLRTDVGAPYDVVYSFGVIHHISAEEEYLRHVRANVLKPGGRLMIAVYSKYSVFNAYMIATWLLKGRSSPLDDWRSQVAELSEPGSPVTIKIRSRREVQRMLERCGFTVERYAKRGFVQAYVPIVGKRLSPNGVVLTALGSLLGWYHCFICR
jgi:2-polyprenyl-3-methyl-5-hydroxy-6-metoxy-1,4-benzoquinol methylase